MADPSRIVADAEALLQRVSPEGRRLAARARQRRFTARMKTARRLAAAMAAVIAVAILWGLLVGPIGQFGFLAALVAMAVAWVAILLLSRTPAETPQTLAQSDLPLLPQRTEAWLQDQRAALPAPAARLVDGIGVRLEALAPQLVALDAREPVAAEVRKLLSIELPELIEGYRRVPTALRGGARDGPPPDRQLADGLGVVDEQLARISADLAAGDLQKLATQGRYLELKYGGEEPG
ncbi:hypothetical protein [Sphingomonas nostoxanthinifaciens]|uniref:hypothetical protein n=1 Tax=Sphingomonas nostoxanthinifaciens TaxID=2872652 RepID=UPI001CC1D5BE|nr:hypothetical protein [Sphingomonas nostoxanthinifaciens]UAK24382.1 hypothetical protein K8P63_19065 [Sphingomonas nostoxanthinifaciens]